MSKKNEFFYPTHNLNRRKSQIATIIESFVIVMKINYDSEKHDKELMELAQYVGNDIGRLCLTFKQSVQTKPARMIQSKGKRQDGIIIGHPNIIFEYKNSGHVFLYKRCDPSVKVFLDDYLRHMETYKLYLQYLPDFRLVYIFKNTKFPEYPPYFSIEIDERLFSQSDLVEDGRVIFHLDNPRVKALRELLN